MTFNKLASEIAFREGKKSQARIGDIREILKIMKKIEKESTGVFGNGIITSLFKAYSETIRSKKNE